MHTLVSTKGRFTPWTMEDGLFPWSNFHGPIFKTNICKVFGPLSRCKSCVDQEDWPCTKRWMCWFFCNTRLKKVVLKEKKRKTILLYALVFFYSKKSKRIIKISSQQHLCAMGHWFFLLEHFFCLSHCKTHWTIPINNAGLKICLLGTSNSMVTMTFFPWCKPKWSLRWLHDSWCKQPLSSS